jgi:UDP-GlcNAc:undecaprenyl-phosphate GlcNAc-1-phosphate transferase
MITEYLIIFASVIIISILSNIISIWIAKKLNLIDYPGSAIHKDHKIPTPMSGGISIFITMFIYLMIRQGWVGEKWLGILIGALVVFLFGLWDDAYKFPYSTKLMGQLMGGMVIIASGMSVEFFRSSTLFWLNWIITLLWVVGIVNAFNFIDSMDNIVNGLSIIGFACLTFIFIFKRSGFFAEMSLVLTGISMVSYFFNRTPAKMFLGDSGAQTLGYFMGTLSLTFIRRNPTELSMLVPPILLLGVPIFNITLVVISRIRRGIPVYKARLDQIYHRLAAMGLKPKFAVFFIHLAGLLLGAAAVLTLYIHTIEVKILFGIIVMIGITMIVVMDNKKLWV